MTAADLHLNEETLVDLAEGAAPEASVPHLADCEACRERLADVRATLAEAAAVEAPEPSPLFWDHLSARVRDAIAAEPPAKPSWADRWLSWKVLAPAACVVAALVLVVRFEPATLSTMSPAPPPVADASVEVPAVATPADDPSWDLIADLASDLDWDAAVDAGMAPAGSVDRAVFDLSADERIELERLLREELLKSGA